MILHVFDNNFIYKGRVENWISMTWTEEYRGEGKFSLLTYDTDKYAELLRQGYYFYRSDRPTAMMAVKVERDTEKNTISVGGYSTLHLLARRIIDLKVTCTNVEEGVYALINGDLRGLPYVECAPTKGLTEDCEFEIEGEVMLDAVLSLLGESSYGIRSNFDHVNKKHVIEVYEGADRTYNSSNGGTVFSQEFGNMKRLVATEDDDLYKNVAYVTGSAKNDSSTVYYQYVSPEAGEKSNWREVIVSGKNQEEDESSTAWKAKQKQIAIEALQEYKNALSFEVELGLGVFGVKYDLGDKVTCKSKRYGLQFDTQIMEYKHEDKHGVETVTIVFGDRPLDYVKSSIVKNESGGIRSSGGAGKDGTSVTVTSVTESTADGGGNVVTFSDGNAVTIKNGSKGSTGDPGKDGKDGKDGYTPQKNVDYFDGKDGQDGAAGSPGADGFSPVVTTSAITGGNRITITDKNGAKSVDVMNGKDGSTGATGSPGTDGVGISSVKQTTTSSADGGNNVMTVTLTNGATSTFTVKNGSKGSTGKAGSDANVTAENITSALGYTPANAGEVGVIFDRYPSDAELKALPNNGYFFVRMTGVATDTETAAYYKTSDWRSNGLKYTLDSVTFYVVPVSQPYGELYLPYYGIKPGASNAQSNSAAMTALLKVAEYGSTFKLPTGHFYFSDPIDISSKHISVIGCSNTVFQSGDLQGTTFLHFPDLADGEVALRVSQCTLRNFSIWGKAADYDMTYNRANAGTSNPIVTEKIGIRAYGIRMSGSGNIENVSAKYFYYGVWIDTCNAFVTDVRFSRCHYGLSIGHDIKVNGLSGAEVMILLQMRGSVSSAVSVRGDSIGDHLVELLGGNCNVLQDIDADFCVNSIISIGDGSTVATVKDLVVSGVHGRNSVSHIFKSSGSQITAENITADTAAHYGLISVEKSSILSGAVVVSGHTRHGNPFDSSSEYVYPYVLLSAGLATQVKNVQFITTSDVSASGKRLTDWVKTVVNSLSTIENACDVRVQTAAGSVLYSKSNGIVSVMDDAEDLKQRMDLTAYAKDADVVKTVNGIIPDGSGNVTIIEEEPIQVESSAHFADTTKKYVLPDGYIYAYRKKVIPAGTPLFTNQLPTSLNRNRNGIYNGVGYKEGVYDKNGTETAYTATTARKTYLTGLIPCKKGDKIRVNAMQIAWAEGSHLPIMTFYDKWGNYDFNAMGSTSSNLAKITNAGGSFVQGANQSGYVILSDVVVVPNNTLLGWAEDNVGYIRFRFYEGTPPGSVVITVNEEIKYTEADEYVYNWENTGELFVKPDYLGMIASLEARVAALEKA